MKRKKRAFTLIEVIVVIVLVGILAAVAIPSYVKSAEKAAERAAIANLMAIRAGVKYHITNSGGTTIPAWGTLAAINNNLGLSIADSVMIYRCLGGGTNHCESMHPNGWMLQFHINAVSPDIIHCRNPGPACPSCPTGHVIGCG